MEAQRNGIISRAFLDKCAITWRFIQLSVIVTYEPNYTVITSAFLQLLNTLVLNMLGLKYVGLK